MASLPLDLSHLAGTRLTAAAVPLSPAGPYVLDRVIARTFAGTASAMEWPWLRFRFDLPGMGAADPRFATC